MSTCAYMWQDYYPDFSAAQSTVLRYLTLSHILDGAKVPIDNSLDNGIAFE
jgi:hypothetical protein